MTFKDKCREHGVNYSSAYTYRQAHPELTEAEVFAHYATKPPTLKNLCMEAGIDWARVLRYKNNQRTYGRRLSNEDVIRHFLTPKKKTFKQLCDEADVNFESARYCKYTHPDWSIKDIIAFTKKKQNTKTFNEKCRENGIKISAAKSYKRAHPNLSDDEIIAFYIAKPAETFIDLCKVYDINVERAYAIKSKYKLTNSETIVYYRPDLNVNLFDEII